MFNFMQKKFKTVTEPSTWKLCKRRANKPIASRKSIIKNTAGISETEIALTTEQTNNNPMSKFSHRDMCFLLAGSVSQCD